MWFYCHNQRYLVEKSAAAATACHRLLLALAPIYLCGGATALFSTPLESILQYPASQTAGSRQCWWYYILLLPCMHFTATPDVNGGAWWETHMPCVCLKNLAILPSSTANFCRRIALNNKAARAEIKLRTGHPVGHCYAGRCTKKEGAYFWPHLCCRGRLRGTRRRPRKPWRSFMALFAVATQARTSVQLTVVCSTKTTYSGGACRTARGTKPAYQSFSLCGDYCGL